MIQAILFDFDGVIADTLSYHVQAWNVVFNDLNIKIENADVALEEGAKALEIAQLFAKKKGLNLSLDELKQRTIQKHDVYRTLTRAKPYPGIVDFIDELKKRSLKIGLVTGSIISVMKEVVDDQFLERFDIIITSEDVPKTKPAPDPYLNAAQQLNVEPEECLVIENAPKGIRAAKSAGMKCLALRTTISDDHFLKEADWIGNHISEVLPILEAAGSG